MIQSKKRTDAEQEINLHAWRLLYFGRSITNTATEVHNLPQQVILAPKTILLFTELKKSLKESKYVNCHKETHVYMWTCFNKTPFFHLTSSHCSILADHKCFSTPPPHSLYVNATALKDMSLPLPFSTSTSSMVSKYWLQGNGEKSRFLPGLGNSNVKLTKR